MNPQPARHLSSIDSSGRGLEVEFTWQEDRFEHTIYLLREGARLPAVASVCDCPEVDLALVELHPQLDSAPTPTLFLHGAGGGAQWSMSVEAVEAQGLRFDVAARVLSPPIDRRLFYRCRSGDEVLLLAPGEATHAQGPSVEGIVTLGVEGADLRSPPCTLRWRYTFTMSVD